MTQEEAVIRAQNYFGQIFGARAWPVAAWPSLGGWLVRLTDSEAEPYETWLVDVADDGTVVIGAEGTVQGGGDET